MKIIHDALLATYLRPGTCRWCGSAVASRCAHHLFARGHGGGRQIDIPCNLIALGRYPIDCECHTRHHNGERPLFEDLLAASAADHDCLQGDIESLVRLIQRMPKWNSMGPERYLAICDRELNFSARRLARAQLESFKHLWDEL